MKWHPFPPIWLFILIKRIGHLQHIYFNGSKFVMSKNNHVSTPCSNNVPGDLLTLVLLANVRRSDVTRMQPWISYVPQVAVAEIRENHVRLSKLCYFCPGGIFASYPLARKRGETLFYSMQRSACECKWHSRGVCQQLCAGKSWNRRRPADCHDPGLCRTMW